MKLPTCNEGMTSTSTTTTKPTTFTQTSLGCIKKTLERRDANVMMENKDLEQCTLVETSLFCSFKNRVFLFPELLQTEFQELDPRLGFY